MAKKAKSRIHKFALSGNDYGKYTISMPKDAKPLSLGKQGNDLFVWARFPTKNQNTEADQKFILVDTGSDFNSSGLKFIGASVSQDSSGRDQVGHLFHIKK